MSECSGSCSTCESGCPTPESLIEQTHPQNNIKHVIGVVSGKGGVGKSMVTSLLAGIMHKKGYSVGILDADITGPSIAKMYGIHGQAEASEEGIYARESEGGIKAMSINLLLENEEDPVVWRGPVIAGVVKQFWTDVIWGDLDYLFIDMPPGTGDVPLTVFQSIPIDAIIVVTSPQDLVSMIVKKAMRMARMMQVPVLGIVENMSYLQCPDCDKKIEIFGPSHAQEICDAMDCALLGQVPVDAKLSAAADAGTFDAVEEDSLGNAAMLIEMLLPAAECTGSCASCAGCGPQE